MWDHVRLLRGTLLLMSLLTFSRLAGQQQQQQSAGSWTVAWLLPLLHSLVFTVGCTAATLQAASALETMQTMGVSLTILNALLLMLYFLRYKDRLVAVLRRGAALEETSAAYHRPGDLRMVQAQFAVIVGLSATACVLSQIQFFGSGQLHHPNYPNPVLVPAALRTPVWYWVIVTLQVLHDISVTFMNAGADLLIVGMADALALLLQRLGRQLGGDGGSDRQVSEEEDKAREGSDGGELSGNEVFLVGPEVRLDHHKDTEAADEISKVAAGARVVMSARICPAYGSLVPAALTSARPESRLHQLVSTHRAVRRLASDAAELCSLPLLCLYTTVTASLLLSVYTTMAVLKSDPCGGAPTNVAYLSLMLLRLLIVSSAGSRLIQRGEQLHDELTDAGWPEHELSPAGRLALQLLLEKTRQPAAFHGWGLFTAQKTTMLSMLGFVLTYTVIFMQMVR